MEKISNILDLINNWNLESITHYNRGMGGKYNRIPPLYANFYFISDTRDTRRNLDTFFAQQIKLELRHRHHKLICNTRDFTNVLHAVPF